MFVITADQVDSRNDRDRAGELVKQLTTRFPDAFVLPPDQTSGDEIQMLLTDAAATLHAVLAIQRANHWSIGLGIGSVRTPLPAATRRASGGAFIAARDAVTRAKRTDARFALAVDGDAAGPGGALTATDVEALVAMLLLVRRRRTGEGWEVVDLLTGGRSQAQAAAQLGISTAAVSQRVKSSLWRVEESALPALVKLLAALDGTPSETDQT
ncbi:DNA-binding protein [Cryobacterium tepidiphilum]|uniref:DNA-binding protein n=1 Tax=Cryobacterium tepidiphilum TaxID=2486026 RepID=A0A3M8LAR1_9MICO|nr:DNA-binding protein [Cryobacterium tepidiphilum]RNE62540.1 DNA-binding protein [Cryobacterium tepidiphilum]